ARTKQTA
nr:Chain D, Histone H3 peptide [synthetic construct]2PVC_E Chain E, Histone H3 peptide [synthetic construct]2PVC_F Chain F, Histone H3 peptide [synthetic construct]3T6R_D Chain D, Histone H3.1t N-terminal peptide [Homo sapiens]4GNE_B Chain B, Histone H3.3 [Homo sapiens]4QBR_E Chain E, Histone H3 [Homo sapiens]4QBR_P Chain P, Histone H3 [Homo sapiens]